jgi:hypothetical protein
VTPFELVLSKLEGVVGTGSKRMALCPTHDDSKQSLSVSENERGDVGLYCHAGCQT